MKRYYLILILSLASIYGFSQEITEDENRNGHLFSHHRIHNPNYTWQGIFRFLEIKSWFFTAILPIHKNAVLKPEVLAGNVNEATLWYSYNLPLIKKLKIGLFFGPGASYSFDTGQGFRARWQYGIGTGNLTDDIPLSFFLLSNITYDFVSESTTWDWYNFGIGFQISDRVKVQYDMEGLFTSNPYTFNNFGFVVDF